MDGSAYVSEDHWAKVLADQGWSNIELRDNRYDAIIHMVTAAEGASEFYNKSNESRYETVEQAIAVDKRLRHTYLGHHKFFMVDNVAVDFN